MPEETSSGTRTNRVRQVLRQTLACKPQAPLEVRRGFTIRRTAGGIPVARLHYSAHEERDPEINPVWKEQERRTYTSQAAWDREQEIQDEAGGGELVYADVLRNDWDKIVITDPSWRPDPSWRLVAGFDHGKTNPTVLERCYVGHDGTLYLCGEYYMPGKEVWEHAPAIRRMADVRKMACCTADPSIFHSTMLQSQSREAGKAVERAKSINQLYIEQGIELFSPFQGDRSDVSFAARVMTHWANLDRREPSLKIVCRNFSERPQPGLHNWDCPNLLWELFRIRRVKLSQHQLMYRNVSEAITDKDNHATDCMKYIVMSFPEPSEKTPRQIIAEMIKPMAEAGELSSAAIWYQIKMEELESE